MAIFDERSELNKQQNRIAPDWDNSFGLKLLGYNQYGKNNAWGHLLGVIPGINTGRHALAQATTSGDTKNVLKDTFDETVARDLAGLSLGVNVAKTVMTMGAGGAGGLSGLKGMFANSNGSMAGLFQGGAPGVSAPSSVGAGLMDKASGLMKSGNKSDVSPELKQIIDEQVANNLVNPHAAGTPEYDLFEQKKMQQQGGLKNKFKELGTDFIKSAGTGNIFESAGNYAAMTIADYKEQDKAFREYAQGQKTSSVFNYL
jgi:hypothetical protein